MLQLQRPMTTQSEPLVLEISPQAIAQAEAMLTQQSHVETAWTAYRHHLAWVTLCQWLQSHNQRQVQPWLAPQQQAAFWEGAPGAALDWGDIRLVLLATETSGATEWLIPQEWVDLPTLAGDYYLNVELDIAPDESWLTVTGYATHEAIRDRAQLQPADRAYVLDSQALITDLTLLPLAQQLLSHRRAPVSATPQFLPEVQAALLQACAAQPIPRTVLPFEQWGALFAQAKWRSQLYEARMVAAGRSVSGVSLRQWLGQVGTQVQQTVEQSWQTLDAIATSLQTTQPTLAYRFGGNYRRATAARFPEAVPGVLDVLNTSVDKETQLSAMYLLGQIGQGNPDAIAALDDFQRTTTDIELRRQAAVSLGKIDPNHPNAGVRRGKILDLGLRLAETPLLLVITLLPEGDQSNIQVRVSPVSDGESLPENLQLIITDGAGNVGREERSRQQTQSLQIAFTATPDDQFGVQVRLGDQQASESFTV